MRISKRLEAVAEAVNFGVAADIGCDHGLTLIYLYKRNKIKKGIACDVKKLPLDKARRNIHKYGCEKAIETRLSDGLSAISPNEADTVIMSGMGGRLTIEILKDGAEAARTVGQFVLQPQRDIYMVRKYVQEMGCKIEDEKMIFEDGKYYNVLNCVRGNDSEYNEAESMFGRKLIESKDEILKEYLIKKSEKIYCIVKNLEETRTEDVESKLENLKKELLICEEVLKCL